MLYLITGSILHKVKNDQEQGFEPTHHDVDHLELHELGDVEPEWEDDDRQEIVQQVAPWTGARLDGVDQTWNKTNILNQKHQKVFWGLFWAY